MNWFGKAVTEALVVKVPPRPVAVSVEAELSKLELDEYKRVADALGLDSPAISKESLLTVLHELGVSIYPYADVQKYMDHLFEGGNAWAWGWRVLRGIDAVRTGLPSYNAAPNSVVSGGFHLSGTIYSKPIPLPVLLTAEKIAERLPKAGFFVSDARLDSEVRDPFLAVSLSGLQEMVVIEVWDEPGFKR